MARKLVAKDLEEAFKGLRGMRETLWNSELFAEIFDKPDSYYTAEKFEDYPDPAFGNMVANNVKRKLFFKVPRIRTEAEHFRHCMKIAKEHRQARLLPIVGFDGKVRVATVHSAPVAWAARAMTKYLLPLLKGLAVTKDILRNNEIELSTNVDNAILYSADLSKATDPISIGLSRFVLDEITRHVGKPEWWDDALDATINTHAVTMPDSSQFESHCGALMGLGPGWAVLCILNSFCAWRAGASKKSFAVCGDDLIGLWTREMADLYEGNLELLGLLANKTKSFRSETHGVFCERFVTKQSDRQARSQAYLRLGEAVAAKARWNRSELCVVDNLLRNTRGEPLSHLARKAALKTLPRSKIPGAFSDGGGGLGRPNIDTVLSYILYGPTSLFIPDTGKDQEEMKTLRASLRLLNPAPGKSVAVSDALVEGMRIQTIRHNQTNGKVRDPPKRRKFRDVEADLKRRLHAVRSLQRQTKEEEQLIQLAFDKNTYVFKRARLLCAVTRLIRRKKYCFALGLLKRSWDVHADVSEVRVLVHSTIKSSKAIIGQRQSLNLSNLGGWSSEPPAAS